MENPKQRRRIVNERALTRGEAFALAFLAFFAGAICFGILSSQWTLGSVVQPLATLLAAFGGAGSAFLLQNRRERHKAVGDNRAAANRALFILAQFANQLTLIQRQLVDPVRESPARLIVMRPTLTLDYRHLKFDVAGLSFLLDTDDPNILGELIAVENKFHTAIDSVNHRSRLHTEQAQPAIEKSGRKTVKSEAELREALGERLFVSLRMATEGAIRAIDDTLASCVQVGSRFSKECRALFPGERIVGFRIEPNENEQSTPVQELPNQDSTPH
jgi:hypothetical protein